ncbi:nucleoside 2-deoxyribosyltransferase domain-containing protein [filamentous cyanobacterium LEGE 11480]|uniref:Nucleoside 2-deoxyribosyltransferase domain-containing protein n=2 Tax=Romeriopsis TaxID=2992131 RepID=A0A928VRM8_9CYAN|nr:nucleoside 2-deoxyribosyltransferase domain-containing protein [Romeriopsis navalis LEGE 11480]
MGHVIKPPTPLDRINWEQSVFLAGSIEMGKAIDWQAQITTELADKDLTILNPRRDHWDSSWEQRMHNPAFRGQVAWELTAQDKATMIVMYFAPETQSPITLLELGLFAQTGKLVVCCPDGFWRKGNVEVVCDRYSIPMVDSIAALVASIRSRFA